MPKVITFSSSKGGTSKTSVCVNLAGAITSRKKALRKKNFKVLVIDLDSQGSASHHLSKPFQEYSGTIVNIFQQNIALEKAIHQYSQNLHFIPCDMDFSHWSEYGKKDYSADLKSLIAKVPEYDFIFLDVPPTFSVYSLVPLFVSDYVILPLSALSGEPSIHGVENQLEIVKLVQEEDNPSLRTLGVVITMVGRTRLSKEVVEYMEQNHSQMLFSSRIPQSAKIAECSSMGKTIVERSPTSKAAQSFVEFGEEFLRKVKQQERRK